MCGESFALPAVILMAMGKSSLASATMCSLYPNTYSKPSLVFALWCNPHSASGSEGGLRLPSE